MSKGRYRLLPYQAGVLVALLATWQVTVQRGWVDPFFFSRPSAIGTRVAEWFVQGSIYRHLWTTTLETILAFLVGAVVGEYLGSGRGLGYVIAQAEGTFDTTGVFAGMTVLAAFTLVVDLLVTLVERRLLAWKPAAAHAERA